MTAKHSGMHTLCGRCMSASIMCLFAFGEIAPASAESLEPAEKSPSEILQPCLRFNMTACVRKTENGDLIVLEDPQEVRRLTGYFKDNVQGVYLNFFIARMIDIFGGKLGPSSLVRLIAKDMPGLESQEFLWKAIYRESNVFYLPCRDTQRSGSYLIKYQPLVGTDPAVLNAAGSEREFIDELIVQAYAATKKGTNIIIGIETSWIPDVQKAVIQGLVDKLTCIARSRGLENVIVKRGSGKTFADIMAEQVAPGNTPLSNIIVLGSSGVLDGKEFDFMKRPADKKEGAFFAKISVPPGDQELVDLRLLDIIAMSMRLAFNEPTPLDNPFVEVRSEGKEGTRTFLFIPRSTQNSHEALRKSYDGQTHFVKSL